MLLSSCRILHAIFYMHKTLPHKTLSLSSLRNGVCHRDLKPENFLQLEEIFEEIFEEIIAQTYAMRFLSKVSLASYDIIPLYPILIPSERAFRDSYTPY